jgi:hypothetical protein
MATPNDISPSRLDDESLAPTLILLGIGLSIGTLVTLSLHIAGQSVSWLDATSCAATIGALVVAVGLYRFARQDDNFRHRELLGVNETLRTAINRITHAMPLDPAKQAEIATNAFTAFPNHTFADEVRSKLGDDAARVIYVRQMPSGSRNPPYEVVLNDGRTYSAWRGGRKGGTTVKPVEMT